MHNCSFNFAHNYIELYPVLKNRIKDNTSLFNDFWCNFALCLTQRCGVKYFEAAEAIAQKTFFTMNNNNGHYHTPLHVLALLMFAARNDIPLTAEDECILWLHDVVNVPLATWNEVRSANFAESVFSSCEMDEKYSVDVSMVQEGILTTAHHMDTEINKTFWTIMDLDLCHFVWRLELFKAADEAVKNELTSVIPLEQYEKGRKDFFQHLLARGFIYRNPNFKIRFEEQAIKNIKLLLL